jgi:small subunit ribosomal protein S16
VVGEHTIGPKSGKFLEKIGSYNPKTKEKTLDAERATYWMSKGAQVSDSLHNLFITMGVIKGKKVNVLPKKTVPKKEEVAAPTA